MAQTAKPPGKAGAAMASLQPAQAPAAEADPSDVPCFFCGSDDDTVAWYQARGVWIAICWIDNISLSASLFAGQQNPTP